MSGSKPDLMAEKYTVTDAADNCDQTLSTPPLVSLPVGAASVGPPAAAYCLLPPPSASGGLAISVSTISGRASALPPASSAPPSPSATCYICPIAAVLLRLLQLYLELILCRAGTGPYDVSEWQLR